MTWTFDHLAFNTADGQTLQDAFGGLLGLTPGRRPPFPFPGRWLYQDGEALVHVIEQPAPGETALSHIAFRTDEEAAVVLKRVQGSGLPYQVAQVPEDGIWQIFVQMPGGVVLELDAKSGPRIKSALTPALSRREREPTEVFSRGTPTWDIESNSGFEKHLDRLPFPLAPPGERAGVRG